MKRLIYKSATRYFYVVEHDNGCFTAHYRPINKRTGQPWQAAREIYEGRDCYQLFNWTASTKSEVTKGQPPSFETWKTDWTACRPYFSTAELALRSAIESKAQGQVLTPVPSVV